ncbi:MAG: alpha/beta fold hydrolase [Lysobacterales bacterium]
MDNLTLVIVPGMDGTGVFLDGLVSELGDFCEITVVRYPPDRPLGYDELVSVALEFIPEGRAVVLLGESFGGPLALKLANLRAAEVRAVILVASFARYLKGRLRSLVPLVRVAPFFAPPASFLRWLLANGRRFAGDSKLRSTLSSLSANAVRRRLASVFEIDARGELGALQVPVLCLRATGDRVVPASAADEIVATAWLGSIVDVPGPHFLLQCETQSCARVIKNFVRRTVG